MQRTTPAASAIRNLRAAFHCAALFLCASATAAVTLPPAEIVNPPSPSYGRLDAVKAQTEQLLKAKDTAGMEALAADLRKSREQLECGMWLLETFYGSAVDVPANGDGGRSAMEFYKNWAKDSPESITAHICLAKAWTEYGWNARGGGYANTVSDSGWKLFGERLQNAGDVLKQAAALKEKCPEWTRAAQTVAMGLGASRSEYMKMVDDAIRAEPTFGGYYEGACFWLLPRWYGQTGDYEKWIAEKASARLGDDRDIEYARYIWLFDRLRFPSEIVFGPGRLDWPRARRGYEAWLRRKPDSLVIESEYARMAVMAGDRKSAAEAFDKVGGKVAPGIWDDKISLFNQARNFAYNDGPNPFGKSND